MKNTYVSKRTGKSHRLRTRMKKRKAEKMPSKRTMYSLLLSSDEVLLLLHSAELSKVIGARLLSDTRKQKLRSEAVRLGKRYAKVSLNRLELELLFAHYSQHIILGNIDLKERAKYFKSYLGAQESKIIEQQVAAYERLKDIHESEEMEEAWDFPEEDYDEFYNR